MKLFADILLLLIAALHLISWCWKCSCGVRHSGRRAFGTTAEFAATTRVLAANQGLYNGFLALGLIWSYWREDMALQLFFSVCWRPAWFGGLSASRKILWVQALPVRDRDTGGLGNALTRRFTAGFRQIF